MNIKSIVIVVWLFWVMPATAFSLETIPSFGLYTGTPISSSLSLGASLGRFESSMFEGAFLELGTGEYANIIDAGYLYNIGGGITTRWGLSGMKIKKEVSSFKPDDEFIGIGVGGRYFIICVNAGLYSGISSGNNKTLFSLRFGVGFF